MNEFNGIFKHLNDFKAKDYFQIYCGGFISSNYRINKFDNLRGIAILLIVLGHYIYLMETPGINTIHNFLYIIHLPIFFFVAGYFSKIDIGQPLKNFKRLFIPFVEFCILYFLFGTYVLGVDQGRLFIDPGYGLWFLISLFTMKMILPVIDKLKFPLLTAFVLSLCIGFIDCNILGISRTFIFLPAFVLGFYYNSYRDYFANNHQRIYNVLKNKTSIIIILIFTIVILLFISYNVPFEWVTFRSPYTRNLEIITRAVCILLGMVFTLILNSVVSNNYSIITKFGENSLAVYVFHIFTVEHMATAFANILAGHEAIFFVYMCLISFAMVYILSRDIVTDILNKMIDAFYNLFFMPFDN